MIPTYGQHGSPLSQLYFGGELTGRIAELIQDTWLEMPHLSKLGPAPGDANLELKAPLEAAKKAGVRFEGDGTKRVEDAGGPEDARLPLCIDRACGGPDHAQVLLYHALLWARELVRLVFPDEEKAPPQRYVALLAELIHCLGHEHAVCVPDTTRSVEIALSLLASSEDELDLLEQIDNFNSDAVYSLLD